MKEQWSADLHRGQGTRLPRRTVLKVVGGGVAGVALGGLSSRRTALAGAQTSPPPVYRIGVVAPSAGGEAEVVGHGLDPQDTPQHRTFRERLAALGYVDGDNVGFEYRYAQSLERITSFAAELAALPVDVLVPQGQAVGAAVRGAGTTPVVFVYQGDPVAQGLVSSLAHPGGNVTGIFGVPVNVTSEKRLRLLKQTVPPIGHVAALSYDVTGAGPGPAEVSAVTATARELGITVDRLSTATLDELAVALDGILASGAEGVDYLRRGPSQFGSDLSTVGVVEWANAHRLPAIYGFRQYAQAGGLMAYAGGDPVELWQPAADKVAQILQGAYPGDLPAESPIPAQFIINLTTAQALGLTIPQSVLDQATEIIGP